MKEKINIDEDIKSFFFEIAKWSRFLGIVGYIGVGILILIAFFITPFLKMIPNADLQNIPATSLAVVYFILAGVYFFPVNYLYKFGKQTQESLEEDNQEGFKSAVENLKSHYKFIGVFTAVLISMYALIFLTAIF